MNTSRLAVIAAVSCVSFWAAKALAIGVAGGLDRSPLESPLFALGLVAHVVAVVLLALVVTARRTVVVRALGTLGLVVVAVGLGVASSMALESVRPADPSWVWSEVNLWVAAALVLTVALVLRRRGTPA